MCVLAREREREREGEGYHAVVICTNTVICNALFTANGTALVYHTSVR